MHTLLVLLISAGSFLPITWTNKAAMPQALAGCGCAVINDTIYVLGGRDSAGNRYATNYIYLPGSDSWSTRQSMSTARAHLAAAYVNGKIYTIGGWVGSTATGVCEEYDPVANTWQNRTSMPTPRYTIAIAVVAGKIYVFGGMNMSGQVFNTVEEYDPIANTWQTRAAMPTARFGAACAVIRDTVYVYGGSTTIGGGLTGVNEFYVPATDTWGTRASMPSPRYSLAGFVFQGRAFSLGGYDYYNYHTLCQAYDPAANLWSTETSMQNARQSLSAAVVGNCVYAIAGWNNGAVNYNEEGLLLTGVQEANNEIHGLSLQVSPNPFRDKTIIRCTIQHPGFMKKRIRMRVYDKAGQMVKDLSANVESGITGPMSSVSWDGKNQTGQQLPAGVYLLVGETSGCKWTQKVVLAR